MRKMVMGMATALALVIIAVPAMTTAQTDSASDTASDQATDRQARIDAFKERVTTRLTAAQERRIANACKAAQGKVTSLQNNLTTAVEKRRSAYANVSDKLEEIVRKLQAASVDTTELEAAITEMNRQAAAVVSAIESYSATLADLAGMDCEADPQGFQAALTVAREQRTALVGQVQGLRDYINGTIKPNLQAIREQLTNDSANGSEES